MAISCRIETPHGRTVEFTYDPSRRITQVRHSVNRTVGYQYDASGRLWKVTDAAGGVTEYTYDVAHRMTTIKDARGIVYLTNEYDTSDRVFRQTQVDTTTYQFAYTVDGGGLVTQADVTNPRAYVRRVAFNGAGFTTSQTEALGTPRARTTTLTRQPGTNFITSLLDPLTRRTDVGYDGMRNLTSVTALAGTADFVTTTATYEPQFNQLASVTDPLNHTWSVSYVGARPTMLVDPLSQVTTLSVTAAGQLASVTDALGQTAQVGYEFSDPVSVTNALGQASTRFFDGAGRLLRATTPLGRSTFYEVNPFNQATKAIDALVGETAFTYDPNGNLLTLTDARGKATTYTYNNMDWPFNEQLTGLILSLAATLPRVVLAADRRLSGLRRVPQAGRRGPRGDVRRARHLVGRARARGN